MGSIEFMSALLVPGYSYARQRAGGDDDECGDGTIANSALDIPAANHQAEFPSLEKASSEETTWQDQPLSSYRPLRNIRRQ